LQVKDYKKLVMKRINPFRVKIIDKYLIREIFFPFISLLLIFTVLIILGNIRILIDLIVNRNIGLIYIIKLFIFLIPQFIGFIIPMALFIGVITAMFRMSSDNEMTVIKASGISLYRVSASVLVFSFLCTLASLMMMLIVTPVSYRYFRDFALELIQNQAVVGLQEKTFNEITDGVVLYPNEISSKGVLDEVLISDSRNENNKKTIFAKKGRLIPGKSSYEIALMLSDGTIHIGKGLSETYRLIRFSSMTLRLDLLKKIDPSEFKPQQKMMSVDELLEKRENKKSNLKRYNSITMEIHQKFAIPFSCIVFGVVAIPFGIIFQRSGKEPGYIICIFLMLTYFIFFMAGKRLGEEGIINPLVATWSPSLIFLSIGAYLLQRVANDKSSWILEISQRITYILSSIQRRLFRKGF